MTQETLEQIFAVREQLQAEQIELRQTLVETQNKIAKNDEDINACSHILERFGYRQPVNPTEQDYTVTDTTAETETETVIE